MKKENYILCGKIGRPFGIKGEVHVFWHNGQAPIAVGKKVYLQADSQAKTLTLLSSHTQDERSTVRFAEIEDRTQAEALTNCELWISESELPRLKSDEYYAYQLLGLQVFDEAGAHLGELVNIYSTGSNDVYEILPQGKKPGEELLVPAIAHVVQKIDLENKKMTIRVLPGLFEEGDEDAI